MTSIEEEYVSRTPASRRAMERAGRVMPGGNTRTTSFFPPYPVVFEKADGCRVWDVDGHWYFDLFNNGLSLIHGHRFPPVIAAIEDVLKRGQGWSGSSDEQIAFAEMLSARLPGGGLVRFTNSGSEAGMLAVEIARRNKDRSLVLKFNRAYHGSYRDLEAGLYGAGDLPGRALIAEFNDATSLARVLQQYGGSIAALIYEPVMFTGRVIPPEPGFLAEMQRLARHHDVLTILDDCLMLRLNVGGSAEMFDLGPDLTILGKFIGGGTPMGAVVGRPDLMRVLDPHEPAPMFHGGSFNGNLVGCAAGRATLAALSHSAISQMDGQMEVIRAHLIAEANRLGVAVEVTGLGSVAGVAFPDDPIRHEDAPTAIGLGGRFYLACVNHGLAMGPGNVMALSTAISNPDVREICASFSAALRAICEI